MNYCSEHGRISIVNGTCQACMVKEHSYINAIQINQSTNMKEQSMNNTKGIFTEGDVLDNAIGRTVGPLDSSVGRMIFHAGTGVKHDSEKPDMSLLSGIALLKVAQVMSFGKKKYSAHNWRGGFAWSRPLAACMRHLVYYIGGEDKDPETGLSHLAHAICCLMFVLEYEETHKELDDRYKGPQK